MRHSLRITLVTVLCVLQLAFASLAFAAPSPWQTVDIVFHAEETGGVMTVYAELAEGITLPAQARLSVPAGADVQWIGEILGGDPAQDPELKSTKTTEGGADIYAFTLTQSRIAQIETLLPAGRTFDGTAYTAALTWPAAEDLPQVRVAVLMPKGAKIVTPAPGAQIMAGDSTSDYYAKTVKDVKAGDTVDLTVTYTEPPAAPAATPASGANAAGGSQGTLVSILLVVVLLVGGVMVVMGARGKIAARTAGAAEEPDGDAAAGTVATSVADAFEDDAAGDASTVAEAASAVTASGAAKRRMVTAIIAGVLVIAAVALGMQAAKPQVVGDTVAEVFAQGEACVTVDIPLSTEGDKDPTATGKKLFDALRPLPGLKSATYDFKNGALSVGFCESETSEAAIREALAPTGVLAEPAAQ